MRQYPPVELTAGNGIATRKPEISVRSRVGSGLLILIYDQAGSSGGIIHLPDDEREIESRLNVLIQAVQADQPGAKIVGQGSFELVSRVKSALQLAEVAVLAESIKEGEVSFQSYPARGIIRFKREFTTLPKIRSGKVGVLVIEETPEVRDLLRRIISRDPDLEVLGEAGSAAEAEFILQTLKPDVLTLDIHMAVEDGVGFLGRLLARKFIPTVLVSSASLAAGETVLDGLSVGAIDSIQKPQLEDLDRTGPLLCEKLKIASRVNAENRAEVKSFHDRPHRQKSQRPPKNTAECASVKLVALGASTGGVQALTEILCQLPEEIPPIVIAQHISFGFSRAFCERLNRICPFHVKEAEDGDAVLPGQVLIAPGGFQMKVAYQNNRLVVRVFDASPVDHHKPSIDVLFNSVAVEVGSRALGVLLTGMGDDGAKGLLEMNKSGAITIAQDEASSVVFGMPGAAIQLGAAQEVMSLTKIGRELVQLAQIRNAS